MLVSGGARLFSSAPFFVPKGCAVMARQRGNLSLCPLEASKLVAGRLHLPLQQFSLFIHSTAINSACSSSGVGGDGASFATPSPSASSARADERLQFRQNSHREECNDVKFTPFISESKEEVQTPRDKHPLVQIDELIVQIIETGLHNWPVFLQHINIPEDVSYEDRIRKISLRNRDELIMRLRRDLIRMNMSAYSRFKRIGSIVNTKEGYITIVWMVVHIENNVIKSMFSMFSAIRKEFAKLGQSASSHPPSDSTPPRREPLVTIAGMRRQYGALDIFVDMASCPSGDVRAVITHPGGTPKVDGAVSAGSGPGALAASVRRIVNREIGQSEAGLLLGRVQAEEEKQRQQAAEAEGRSFFDRFLR